MGLYEEHSDGEIYDTHLSTGLLRDSDEVKCRTIGVHERRRHNSRRELILRLG